MGQIVGPWGPKWISGLILRRFLGAFGVPLGTPLETFSGFLRHVFSMQFRTCFRTVFSRFWVAFGILRASFLRPFGDSRLWQKQKPRLHGSYVFSVSSSQKHGFFLHRFSRGSRRRFVAYFGVFGLRWGTRRRYFGHQWALI